MFLYPSKEMKKSIISMLLVSVTTISSVYANDCHILVDENKTSTIDQNIESITNAYEAKYAHALPSNAFKRALINLKAYCCTQILKKTCSSSDIENIQEYYPQSAFFFDHVLDVAMRRLDGVTGLAYNESLDPTGLERRTKVTEMANSANGMPANTIETEYIKYRTGHIDTTKNLNTVISGYKQNNLATLSLGDKYNTICEIVTEIYNKTFDNNATIIWTNTETNSFFNKCKAIVQERVKRETGYIRILMVQKSNQLYDETTKAYTKKYFMEEKMMALWNLIAKVKDMFKTIVQQAAVSKTCSK